MILKEIEKEIIDPVRNEISNGVNKQSRGEWILPFYDKFCLSNIPATIADFFDIQEKRSLLSHLPQLYRKLKQNKDLKVIFLVVDGFGYYQWLRSFQSLAFFRQVTHKGVLLPLTSIFPSTTTAAITTLQTGLTPQEHGLFEWFLYFKELDRIIMPLPFSPMEKRSRNKLLDEGVSPRILFRGKNIHEKLKKRGVPSYSFLKENIANGAYNSIFFRGSEIVSYKTHSELIVSLGKHLKKTKGPAYFYAYWGEIDTISHDYSPRGEEYVAEVATFSYHWQNFIANLDKTTAKNTLLMLVADHGQIPVDPKKTIYLNKLKWLTQSFAKSEKGNRILPSGSPRDVFLHINPVKKETIYKQLLSVLRSKVTILETEKAIENKLFGTGRPTKKFRERAGNLLILPLNNNTVWFTHPRRTKFSHLGHHGGLTPEEMLIPFAVAKLEDLV